MAATPISWNAPSTANAQLSPLFDSAGGVSNCLVQLTDAPGANGAPHAQCIGVLNIGRYVPARYSVDSQGADCWMTPEPGPRRIFGVTGWVLAQ
ncbi:hypothetical protein [Paraburkholderia pallida]|uniref:Uncharacterized protein n=1 Tax=Paraburkholderia pallida TaxID=2547399 RepID=A0A4P7CPX3_9BURK|nr:hypothetical protein [Paraburkholderia pallida]QBQ96294.1 hypothetical protein E1956_03310 [Paraburkholderia pallida]